MIDWQEMEMRIYHYEAKTTALAQFLREDFEEGLIDQVYAELMRWDQ
jgi:hypothetical protein